MVYYIHNVDDDNAELRMSLNYSYYLLKLT